MVFLRTPAQTRNNALKSAFLRSREREKEVSLSLSLFSLLFVSLLLLFERIARGAF